MDNEWAYIHTWNNTVKSWEQEFNVEWKNLNSEDYDGLATYL